MVFIAISLGTGRVHLEDNRSGRTEATVRVETWVQSDRSLWDGAILPPHPAGQPKITLLSMTIPPGVRLESHLHPVLNAGVLLSGALTVVTEESGTLPLRPGDALVEVVHTWHYGINEGKTSAELVVFNAEANGIPLSIRRESSP